MTSDDQLSCREVVELVTGYLEQVLLSEMRKRFEAHVAECPGCEYSIEQVRLTSGMLHQVAKSPDMRALAASDNIFERSVERSARKSTR